MTRFVLWLALLGPGAPLTITAQEAVRTTSIELFVREGCQHCEQAKAFLDQLAQEQPGLRMQVHDVRRDPQAMRRLERLAETHGGQAPRVPTLWISGQLIVGYSTAAGTDRAIRRALAGQTGPPPEAVGTPGAHAAADSCTADDGLACRPTDPAPAREPVEIEMFGRPVPLQDLGLPTFSLAMGVLGGFSPCGIWVLLLMVSILAPLRDRPRMLAVAGSYLVTEGMATWLLTTAWLGLFYAAGLSRASQWTVATLAGVAGLIHVKDFYAQGKGPSLSTPDRAKPGIYERLRRLLQAPTLPAAALGAAMLALLIQGVDLLCTSGLQALFTQVLAVHAADPASTRAHVALYTGGYLAVHGVVLGLGVAVLSRRRLQERQGRWLKLLSGVGMLALSAYLLTI